MSFSLSEYTKIYVGWGFVPDPTGQAYSAPQTPSWVQGGRFAAGEERRGQREGLGEEGKGGERGMGRDGKRGKLGNSALVVGGQTPLLKYTFSVVCLVSASHRNAVDFCS